MGLLRFWVQSAEFSNEMSVEGVLQTENGISYYQLMNVNSGRCLDVAWFSQMNGGKVVQATVRG